jgi:hypothetical protein
VALNCLVAAYSGVVLEVPRFGLAYGRVDQDVGLMGLGRVDDDATLDLVHRIGGVEGDDAAPAHLSEPVV